MTKQGYLFDLEEDDVEDNVSGVGRQLFDAEDIIRFVHAGKARLTLKSIKTGTRYTFKVTKVRNAQDRFFVSLLTGSDNTSSYSYIGLLENKKFRLTSKSQMTDSSTPVKAFRFMCTQVIENETVPEQLEVWHEGRCGRCNRLLTVPESIERGIGPECWSKMTTTKREQKSNKSQSNYLASQPTQIIRKF
jgi:hypothetical protein